MLKYTLLITSTILLTACATTPESRAKELAYCEQMESRMGTDHVHDHASARGAGVDPMNVTHARCRELLSRD